MIALKKNDKVKHKRYGESYVIKIIKNFGPIIQPTTKEGLELLETDSGAAPGTPYLCSDYKRNLTTISNDVMLTALEANALWSAAEQMRLDMEDYHSYMPKEELKKFIAAYESGLDKLSKIFIRGGLGGREITEKESSAHDAINGN